MQVGEHTYGSEFVTIKQWTRNDTVVAGKFCSLSSDIKIVIDGNHNVNTFSSFPFRERLGWEECPPGNWGKETPTIGNDVWISDDVVIYSGCHIGDGAVIAGQSVITTSVPPYAIVAGNPARIIKYRFPPEIIRELLCHKWWDLPLEVIRSQLIPYMHDIHALLRELRQINAEL